MKGANRKTVLMGGLFFCLFFIACRLILFCLSVSLAEYNATSVPCFL